MHNNTTPTPTQSADDRWVVSCADGIGGLPGVGDIIRCWPRDEDEPMPRLKLIEEYGPLQTARGTGGGPNYQRFYAQPTNEARDRSRQPNSYLGSVLSRPPWSAS